MAMTLITTNTESGDANSAFTSSIDSTYKLYIFKWYDCNPATDEVDFTFNGSIDGGSNYNVLKTTTAFRAFHFESDAYSGGLDYQPDFDIANGTGYKTLAFDVGNGADESCAGELYLFNPSSTTYVKHFYSTCAYYYMADAHVVHHTAGYFNDADDNIDAIDFKFASGNMDGVIKMYGVG